MCVVTDATSSVGVVLIAVAVAGNSAIFAIDHQEYDPLKIIDIINKHEPHDRPTC